MSVRVYSFDNGVNPYANSFYPLSFYGEVDPHPQSANPQPYAVYPARPPYYAGGQLGGDGTVYAQPYGRPSYDSQGRLVCFIAPDEYDKLKKISDTYKKRLAARAQEQDNSELMSNKAELFKHLKKARKRETTLILNQDELNNCLHKHYLKKIDVKILLDLGADPNCRDAKGRTVVHKAAIANWFFTLRILLDRSGSPYTIDANNMSPLDYAISEKAFEAIEAIIESGYPLNEVVPLNLLPLDIVLYNYTHCKQAEPSKKIVNYFYKKGAQLELTEFFKDFFQGKILNSDKRVKLLLKSNYRVQIRAALDKKISDALRCKITTIFVKAGLRTGKVDKPEDANTHESKNETSHSEESEEIAQTTNLLTLEPKAKTAAPEGNVKNTNLLTLGPRKKLWGDTSSDEDN